MTHISLQEVESNLHAVIERIRNGEELILEQDGILFCTVKPLPAVNSATEARKRIGFLEGQGSFPENWKKIGMEDFDEAIDRKKWL